MDSAQYLRASGQARKRGKKLREISHWAFGRWKAMGLTHCCLKCGPGPLGFRIEEDGTLVGENEISNEYLQGHDGGCTLATIPNLQNYKVIADWVEAELPDESMYIITVS